MEAADLQALLLTERFVYELNGVLVARHLQPDFHTLYTGP